MRRRPGFTLVEVLVAMALILFIMTILAASFSTATQVVSDLKSAGDCAERLRGAKAVILRDLEATHIYDGGGNAQRLSTIWNTNNGLNPNPLPPAYGYFRIYEKSAAALEGVGIDGLPSYNQNTVSLAYTISLTGNRRNDFLSAYVPGSPLTTDPALGSPDQRYEDTPSAGQPATYNSQIAEVALFLVQETDVTDANTGPAQPLFTLYRRQLLAVPPTPLASNDWSPGNIAATAANVAPYVEVSTIPTAGEVPSQPNLSFNSLKDLNIPYKRFWMNRTSPAGNYQPVTLPTQPPSVAYRYPDLNDVNTSYQNADLLLQDVLSMDVRVLVAGGPAYQVMQGGQNPPSLPDYEDLFNLTNQGRTDPRTGKPWFFTINNTFTADPVSGPARVFDTWTSATTPAYDYSTWMTAGQPTSIPIYKDNNGNPISIQAIKITLRVWDFKTKKTRQVTIVQQM